MQDSTRDLRDAHSFLTSITGRILQVSDRKASVALGAATNAVVGASFASAVTGAVGSLAYASTGAAIAGLSGAAKTTATLYWVGGLIGGGVAAGTALIGVGALGAGVYGSIKVRQALLGASRRDSLSPREQTIVLALHELVRAIDTALSENGSVSHREVGLFSRLGLSPLLEQLQAGLKDEVFGNLTTYNRIRLRGHIINLRRLQRRLEQK